MGAAGWFGYGIRRMAGEALEMEQYAGSGWIMR